MMSLKELWEKSRETIFPEIKKDQYFLIILSVSLGSTVPQVLSYTDIVLVSTGITFLDLLLDSLFLVVGLLIAIYIFIKMIELIFNYYRFIKLSLKELIKLIKNKIRSF